MLKSKIGITGASGHIGSVLTSMLLEMGHEVGILIFNDDIQIDGVQKFKGSITDADTVDKFVQEHHYIIHMAAKIDMASGSFEDMIDVNVNGVKNICQSCIKHKVKRLVHFSSIAAIEQFPLDEAVSETRPLIEMDGRGTKYGKSKAAGEKVVLDALKQGLNAVIVAPTSVLGPYDRKPSILGQSLIDIYNDALPALVPGGQDWVDVRDICEGTIAALEKGITGEKYLLGNEFLSIAELSKTLGTLFNRKVPSTVLPFWLARLGIPFEYIKAKISGKQNGFTNEALDALKFSNPQVSHEKAGRDLGYSPRSIERALKDTIEYFKVQGLIK